MHSFPTVLNQVQKRAKADPIQIIGRVPAMFAAAENGYARLSREFVGPPDLAPRQLGFSRHFGSNAASLLYWTHILGNAAPPDAVSKFEIGSFGCQRTLF